MLILVPFLNSMSISELNQALQVGCIVLLCLLALLFFMHSRRELNTWAGIGFIITVICYLIVDSAVVQQSVWLFTLVVTGALLVPVFFYMLTRAIFDDHFTFSKSIFIWFLIQLAPYFHLYLRNIVTLNEDLRQILITLGKIISIGFILAGLFTALKTKQGDLIESRLRFRNHFIIITAALIGITLIVELLPIVHRLSEALQIIQRSSILALTAYFLINNFALKSGFFFKELPKEKPAPVPVNDSLRLKLEDLIDNNKIYRKEGLSIRELAELMNEQEYRLRRLINGELGFRNFNDFLNQYRVEDACSILSDPAQNRKTVLEIAYELGYQSIGPFNKAFKELKHTTPTTFRKASQA